MKKLLTIIIIVLMSTSCTSRRRAVLFGDDPSKIVQDDPTDPTDPTEEEITEREEEIADKVKDEFKEHMEFSDEFPDGKYVFGFRDGNSSYFDINDLEVVVECTDLESFCKVTMSIKPKLVVNTNNPKFSIIPGEPSTPTFLVNPFFVINLASVNCTEDEKVYFDSVYTIPSEVLSEYLVHEEEIVSSPIHGDTVVLPYGPILANFTLNNENVFNYSINTNSYFGYMAAIKGTLGEFNKVFNDIEEKGNFIKIQYQEKKAFACIEKLFSDSKYGIKRGNEVTRITVYKFTALMK